MQSALDWLTPALTRGMQRQATESSGLEELWKALETGNHEKYVEDPSYLGRPETESDGNAILGHIFGSKEVSNNVAYHASKETGIGATILKQMLPYVATAVMGALSKKVAPTSGSQPNEGQKSSLLSWLDADKDGSILDDMLGHAFRQFVS